MTTSKSRCLVTGGAGFIGSNLTRKLMSVGRQVTVLDDMSSGSRSTLEEWGESDRWRNLHVIEGDCTNSSDVREALSGANIVFHLAANPEVRLEKNDSQSCLRNNLLATHVLLDEMKDARVNTILYTSSSTVYGRANILPTSEDYGPLWPISFYGASKLASESLISAHCHTYRTQGIVLRLANVVGPRCRHGVLHDFVAKLARNSSELEILGDGTQRKSYLHVEDCISAIEHALLNLEQRFNVFNVGSLDWIDVTSIARILAEEMGVSTPLLKFTARLDDGSGWIGDVKSMLLDVTKLRLRGWYPKNNSEQSIRKSAKSMVAELNLQSASPSQRSK